MSRKEVNRRYKEKKGDAYYEMRRKWAIENQEATRKHSRDCKRRKREALVESLGGCCSSCGCKDNLEMDHIDMRKKTMMPSTLAGMADDNPHKVEEIKNIQILCKKCHREKTNKQLELAWALFRSLPLDLEERWMENPPTSLDEVIQTLHQYQ
tara:strand:+ start:127 stop:585 length:459 start_codon:yes stop_codon:yes gene_type:complete